MKKKIIIRILLILPFLAISSILSAQNTNDTARKLDDYYIDFTPPDLSAFSLLGVNPTSVTRPSNLKELAIGILNFNTSGKMNPGIALEWAPLQTLNQKFGSLNDYRKNYLVNAIQITAGTNADSNGTNLAVGIRWLPIDQSNLLLNKEYAQYITDVMSVAFQNTADLIHQRKVLINDQLDKIIFDQDPTANKSLKTTIANNINTKIDNDILKTATAMSKEQIKTEVVVESIEKATGKKIDDIFSTPDTKISDLSDFIYASVTKELGSDKAAKEIVSNKKKDFLINYWNATKLEIASGIVTNSNDGTWDNLKSRLWSGYITYTQRLGKNAEAIGEIKGNKYFSDTSTYKNDFFAGARLLIGNYKSRLSIEFGYSNQSARIDSMSQKTFRCSLGFETKITDGLWIEAIAALNQPTNKIISRNPIGLVNLKYALQKSRRFQILQ